jgi:hypothetical protein
VVWCRPIIGTTPRLRRSVVTHPEYIATGTGSPTSPGYFDDLLDMARQMPDVQVKKIAKRYVVFAASDDDIATMTCRLGDRYQISPNKEISLFE